MGKLNILGELDINSYLTAATTFYISSKDNTSIIFRHGSTEYARINPSGCLCINTTSTTDAYKLYVSGASLFSSSAYFRSNIWANNSAIGGSIAFLPTRSTDNNATGIINYYACGSTSATSYNLGSFYFTQYSYASGTYNRVEYYDRYNLPAVAADKIANNTYSILTTKNTITVAQGGTGRSSLTSGYALVGNGTSAVSLREITSTATSGSTALITSGGAYSAVATSITNITRSGTTFTATRADGTTFTFTQQDNDTDTKVQQSRSTSASWRALLSHYTATTQGTDPAAAINVVYYNEKASIQPSTGKIYSAGGFIGNASTATKLATARTISLTGSVTGSGSFDGSGNLSITTTTNHTHSYLPLSGGTMTGTLSLKANQYFTDSASGMDCNNSDIIDLNAIYFGDAVDSAGEGINFYRSSTTWDSLYAKSGALYFHPNRATATNVSGYTILHSNNWSSYCAAASHSHSGYASIAAHNNLTASGNEFTFASSAFSGVMYVNYRTASGSLDGSISEYRFQNGAGKETAIRCTYVYGTAQTADYATSAGYAGYLPSYTEYSSTSSLDGFLTNGVLRWAKATAAALSFGNDGSVISVGWGGGYGSQVWLDDGSGPAKIAVRNRSGGSSWNGWRHCVMSCSETYYGSSLPSSGNVGDVFFKI